MKTRNIVWADGHISKEDRSRLLKFNNKVVWFTGLSSSGKSTLARELERELHNKGILSYILDGDNVRHGLNNNLGFSKEDRNENIRRITEVAKLFHDAGIFILVSFISPYKEARDKARELIGKDFIEVFVDCSLEECEKRDVKGLYKKARAREIKDFTGVGSSYEIPINPEIIVDTHNCNTNDCVKKIIEYLEK